MTHQHTGTNSTSTMSNDSNLARIGFHHIVFPSIERMQSWRFTTLQDRKLQMLVKNLYSLEIYKFTLIPWLNFLLSLVFKTSKLYPSSLAFRMYGIWVPVSKQSFMIRLKSHIFRIYYLVDLMRKNVIKIKLSFC